MQILSPQPKGFGIRPESGRRWQSNMADHLISYSGTGVPFYEVPMSRLRADRNKLVCKDQWSARHELLTARLVGKSSSRKALSEFAECIDQVAQ